MQWPTPLQPARFVRRENRFRAIVERDGQLLAAHVPNSGRLGELFTPGAAVWVAPFADLTGRKTVCHLALVEYAGTLVSVDARLPNRLVAEALAAGRLTPLAGYATVRAEVRTGASRLDFLLSDGPDAARPRCWLEVKSVTLVEDGLALFPDAPTTRGVKHLEELAALRRATASGWPWASWCSAATPCASRPTPRPTRPSPQRCGGCRGRAWRCTPGAAQWTTTRLSLQTRCRLAVKLTP